MWAGDAAITRNPGWSNTRRLPGLLDHDPVRYKPGIDIAGDARGIVGQRHGSAADNEHVRDDASAGQPLAQGTESPFQLGPAKKDIVGLAHAASRSLAER